MSGRCTLRDMSAWLDLNGFTDQEFRLFAYKLWTALESRMMEDSLGEADAQD